MSTVSPNRLNLSDFSPNGSHPNVTSPEASCINSHLRRILGSPRFSSSPIDRVRRQENVKVPHIAISFNDSSSSDELNRTGRAVDGVDISIIEEEKTKFSGKSLVTLPPGWVKHFDYIENNIIQSESGRRRFATSMAEMDDDVDRFFFLVSIGKETTKLFRGDLWTFFEVALMDGDQLLYVEPATILVQRMLWDMCATWKEEITKEQMRKRPKWLEMIKNGLNDKYIVDTLNIMSLQLRRWTDENNEFSIALMLEDDNIATTQSIWNCIFQDNRLGLSSHPQMTIAIMLYFAFHGLDEDQSIEWWFRHLDTDQDGILSLYEMKSFYESTCDFLRECNVDALPFEEYIHLVMLAFDKRKPQWRLHELKRNRFATKKLLVGLMAPIGYYEMETTERTDLTRLSDLSYGRTRTQWERHLSERSNLQ